MAQLLTWRRTFQAPEINGSFFFPIAAPRSFLTYRLCGVTYGKVGPAYVSHEKKEADHPKEPNVSAFEERGSRCGYLA